MILKIFFSLIAVLLALGAATLIAYAEMIAEIPAYITLMPNLFIGSGIGFAAVYYLIVYVWDK